MSFYGIANAFVKHRYWSTEHFLPPMEISSTSCPKFTFLDSSSLPKYLRRQLTTSAYLFQMYVLCAYEAYFSFIVNAVRRNSFRLIEMHTLSRKSPLRNPCGNPSCVGFPFWLTEQTILTISFKCYAETTNHFES